MSYHENMGQLCSQYVETVTAGEAHMLLVDGVVCTGSLTLLTRTWIRAIIKVINLTEASFAMI